MLRNAGWNRADRVILQRLLSEGLGVLMALSCASCAEVNTRKYRNDALIQEYKYTLGEQYIQVNGLKVCYQETGHGDETILIIPGLGTSVDFWQLVVPPISQHYRVVAMDPPGFGKSDKPEVSYSLKWIAQQIVDFMNEKGIQRATLMGGSLGGHFATMIAIDHPDRVDRLILMGSCGAWPQANPLVIVGLETLWQDPIVVNHLRAQWPKLYWDIVGSHTEVSERLFAYQMAMRANGRVYWDEGRAASRSLKSIFFNSCRPRMDEIKKPTLLVWGENDRIHLLSEGIYFRQHLPDARLVIVPNSAHEVILDQPQVMTDLVLRFMHGGTAAIDETPNVQRIIASAHEH
jgi:pimeloyl-ACP methyl ester carboxylesterase